MTWFRGQSSWSVTRIRLPKISSSSPACAFGSIRQDRRNVAGVSPVSSVVITRATQRGAQMVSISACTFECGRRVRPRAGRSASVLSAAVALRRVWANPACWAVCRPGEWVRITRRRRPSTIAVVSNAVRSSSA
jgi:hypothetical protein